MRTVLALLSAVVLAASALAQDEAEGLVPDQTIEVEAPEADVPLPRPRPAQQVEQPADAEPVDDAPATEPEEAPPARIYQAACPALLQNLVVAETLPPIEEESCGERDPLSVTALTPAGTRIDFSEPVTTNCRMATGIADWAAAVDAYSRATLDAGVETLVTGPGYVCRDVAATEAPPRLSEHGFANAIDIAALLLTDGTRISVLEDWDDAEAPAGRLLRYAHAAACARFTTVLGPEADDQHADHFHFDLGCHGQSCTARICQ